jgi:hypothetical protein
MEVLQRGGEWCKSVSRKCGRQPLSFFLRTDITPCKLVDINVEMDVTPRYRGAEYSKRSISDRDGILRQVLAERA